MLWKMYSGYGAHSFPPIFQLCQHIHAYTSMPVPGHPRAFTNSKSVFFLYNPNISEYFRIKKKLFRISGKPGH